MLNSVFLKTVRDMRGQIVGWGIGVSAMIGITVLVFPTMQDMSDMESLFQMLPPALQKLIGSQTSFTVLDEFLRMKFYDSWLPVIWSVFAIVHAAAAVVGEEERGTMDLLMANPVKRWRVLLEKFAAIAVALTAMSALTCVGLVAAIVATGVEAGVGRLIWATFNVVPIALVFGAVSLTGSCVFRRTRHASAVAVVVLVVSFFISTLAPLAEALRPWLHVSLFHYYTKTQPFGEGAQPGSMMVLLVVLVLLLTAAVAAFRRKDLAV